MFISSGNALLWFLGMNELKAWMWNSALTDMYTSMEVLAARACSQHLLP